MSMETAEKEFFRTKFKKQNAELVISAEGFIPSNMEEQYKKEMTEWLKKLKNFRTDEELVSILIENDRRYTWKYIDDFDEGLNPLLLVAAKMIGKKVVYTNKRKGIHFSLDHNWNFQGTMNNPETGELILTYHEFSAKDLNQKQKESYISFGKLAEFLTSGKTYLKYDKELDFWIQKKRERENFFTDNDYYDIFSYSNPYFVLNIKKDEVLNINFYSRNSNKKVYGIENFLTNEVFDGFSYEQIVEIISSLTKLILYFEKYKTKSKKIVTSLLQTKESIEKTLKKRYGSKVLKPTIEAETLEKVFKKIEDAINNNKENKCETFSGETANKQGENIKTENKRKIFSKEKIMEANKYQGKFIVVEGPNGSGKSTYIKKLVAHFENEGKEVFSTKEISNSKVGRFAYDIMGEMNGLAYACLMASDRYEHLKTEIIPALKEGKIVICDRYALSSLIYQQMDGVKPSFILDINSEIIRPDLTIVLTADADVLSERKIERAKETGKPLDRFETGEQSEIELHFLEDGIKRLEKKSWKIAKLRNEKDDDFERNLEIGIELINQI